MRFAILDTNSAESYWGAEQRRVVADGWTARGKRTRINPAAIIDCMHFVFSRIDDDDYDDPDHGSGSVDEEFSSVVSFVRIRSDITSCIRAYLHAVELGFSGFRFSDSLVSRPSGFLAVRWKLSTDSAQGDVSEKKLRPPFPWAFLCSRRVRADAELG